MSGRTPVSCSRSPSHTDRRALTQRKDPAARGGFCLRGSRAMLRLRPWSRLPPPRPTRRRRSSTRPASSCAATRRSAGCATRRCARSSRSSRSRTSPGTRRSSRRRPDPSRNCTSSSAGSSAGVPTTRRPTPTARSAPRAVPGGRAVRGRHHDEDLPRAAGHVLLPAVARRFPGAAPGVARVRAVLHAGDHGNAQAVAREPLQPVQPARDRPADAHALARRARAARAGLLPATATLREAAQTMADESVRTVIVVDDRGAPVGCSRSSTC